MDLYGGMDPRFLPSLKWLKWTPQLEKVVGIMNNSILPRMISSVDCIEQLNQILYCAAAAILMFLGITINDRENMTKNKQQNHCPPWKQRLEKKINSLRRDIGRLTEYQTKRRSPRHNRLVAEIMRKTKVHPGNPATRNRRQQDFIDTLKQSLKVYSNRLRRYNNLLKCLELLGTHPLVLNH